MALGKQMTSPEDAATAGLDPVKGNKNQTDLSMLLSSRNFFLPVKTNLPFIWSAHCPLCWTKVLFCFILCLKKRCG